MKLLPISFHDENRQISFNLDQLIAIELFRTEVRIRFSGADAAQLECDSLEEAFSIYNDILDTLKNNKPVSLHNKWNWIRFA